MALAAEEIQRLRVQLAGQPQAIQALQALETYQGNYEASFAALMPKETLAAVSYAPGRPSLWEVTLEVMRERICGDGGFSSKVKEYSKNPTQGALLVGVITSLAEAAQNAGLDMSTAAMTVIALYILSLGLDVFCKYTKPS
ncbi:hypothetical protein [Candidatus Cyanaurora vandensis]|uniref:hypothetical protein n=1 Tax=Candidatus Cyanaurora vandensis TaxID=2714958 RepID=UPI0025805D6D|nr:hypothetical protein [Candidatus Cyanaurora vandensis]